VCVLRGRVSQDIGIGKLGAQGAGHSTEGQFSRAPAAPTCNPSYSGGRDQEDLGLKPARKNSSWDPISIKTLHKKSWWSGSRCRPWVQSLVLYKQQTNKNPKKPEGQFKKGLGYIYEGSGEPFVSQSQCGK
jgi:hypothetical protein